MSGLVLDERAIDKTKIKEKTITIARCNYVNMGVRVWFQILTTEGERFQRWSMLMNPTDEVLILMKEGDNLDIKYYEDTAEDLIHQTHESFNRIIILEAAFK